MSSTKLVVVDISSFIFRAFFAIRQPMTSEDGTPTNAVYGVMNMMEKLISRHQPTHIVMARDLSGPSFRHEIYTEYKANRSEAPDELKPQFALIEKLLNLMKLPEISAKGYEADDVIGSVVTQYQDKFDEVIIASGDKDLMQFVNDKVVMLDTMKSKTYTREAVFEKMGVWPEQVVDYLSLVGDASDNIPGVKGIGAKGAAKLLGAYHDLDGVFANIGEITNKRVLNGLTEHADDARLSKSLVNIVCDLKLDKSPEELKYKFHVDEDLLDYLKSLRFKTIIKKLESFVEIDAATSEPAQARKDYDIKNITSKDLLSEYVSNTKNISVFYELKDSQALSSFYLLGDEQKQPAKVMIHSALSTLDVANVFNKYLGHIICDDVKPLIRSFLFHGVEPSFKFFDLSVAGFNLRADKKNHFEVLVERYLDREFTMPKLEEGLLQEKEANDYDQAVAERLELTFELEELLKKDLADLDVEKIYQDIDSPSIKVLSQMEAKGISLDREFLKKLEDRFCVELAQIEDDISKAGGAEVNLRSPKQVGVLLFETLGFPVIKKTKTGYSTAVEVLQELEKRVESPIPSMIIKYRELDKLLSTYVKALPEILNEETQRVHTNYNLTVASTGRLSSDRPNLQNIPTRTENGKLIRKAFVAGKDRVFVGADYSQVELRILAHYCEDETMIKAFKEGVDIHSQTASEIFGVPLDEMTSDIRSKAKAINFGLIYGQSSFGLSQALGISRKEAKEYIDHYFERFSSVKNFLESLKEDCRESGYASTLWGRKRYVGDINSTNHMVKAGAERVAINSPVQGTAADIIKKAMLNVQARLLRDGIDAQLILQVHDELIVECDESLVDQVKLLLEQEMMNAAELKVPLRVDVNSGKTWYDLK